jgi:predicted enzyme related to lactoylglutathione lyase
MSEHRGRFVWYELMTKDVSGAKAFYPKVTGWTIESWQGPMDYSMFAANGKPFSGVMTLPDEAAKMGAPSNWMGYVAVPDVDASAKQATELGGQVYVPPQDIPNVGRFSVIADPQGAAIALFRGTSDMPLDDSPAKLGEISWHELITSDSAAAWTFYSTLFGWEKTDAMDMGPHGVYQMFAAKGSKKTLGGMMTAPPNHPAPPAWLYYAHVPDLHEALAAIKANGGQVLNGPMDIPGDDEVAQCMDPQGAAFALHAHKRK